MKLQRFAGQLPTCEKDGVREYWQDMRTGVVFADRDGRQAVSREAMNRWLTIPALGHDLKEKRKGGKLFMQCKRCGQTIEVAAQPVDEITPEEEFVLESSGEDYVIKQYIGNRKRVVIPSMIRGRKVSAIAEKAFAASVISPRLEYVRIPETVTQIERGTFSGCRKLKEVKAHPGIVKIGTDAFFNCIGLVKLDFGMGDCPDRVVKLPKGLKELYPAFYSKGLVFTSIIREITLSRSTQLKKDWRYMGMAIIPQNCAVFYYED